MSRTAVALLLACGSTLLGPAPSLQAQAPGAEGEWAISFDLPQGPVSLDVALVRNDGAWEGAAQVDHVGPARIATVTSGEGRTGFRVEVQFEGTWYALDFEGEVVGDLLEGTVRLPDGNRTAFRAVRTREGSPRSDRVSPSPLHVS